MRDNRGGIPTRKEAISAHKEGGGLIAATLPILYPRELLRAFGVLPVEVWGPPGVDATGADRWLQAYTCGIIRGALAFLEQGGLEQADMILVPHACDSLQGLGSVLLDFPLNQKPVTTFYYPRSGGEAAIDYLEGELRASADRLEGITGRAPSFEELNMAIGREEEADELLRKLLAFRQEIEMGDRDFYRVVRSREYLPAEQFVEISSPLLKQEGAREGAPILVSGIVPEPMDFFEVLEGAGARVVGDDFAAIGRRVPGRSKAKGPFRRMAERLAGAPPCSTRGASISDRLEHLKGLTEAGGARGVVFLGVKFCEPELFYLPGLRAGLEAMGLRSLVVEVDPLSKLPHQAITRLEAFVEIIS